MESFHLIRVKQAFRVFHFRIEPAVAVLILQQFSSRAPAAAKASSTVLESILLLLTEMATNAPDYKRIVIRLSQNTLPWMPLKSLFLSGFMPVSFLSPNAGRCPASYSKSLYIVYKYAIYCNICRHLFPDFFFRYHRSSLQIISGCVSASRSNPLFRSPCTS